MLWGTHMGRPSLRYVHCLNVYRIRTPSPEPHWLLYSTSSWNMSTSCYFRYQWLQKNLKTSGCLLPMQQHITYGHRIFLSRKSRPYIPHDDMNWVPMLIHHEQKTNIWIILFLSRSDVWSIGYSLASHIRKLVACNVTIQVCPSHIGELFLFISKPSRISSQCHNFFHIIYYIVRQVLHSIIHISSLWDDL